MPILDVNKRFGGLLGGAPIQQQTGPMYDYYASLSGKSSDGGSQVDKEIAQGVAGGLLKAAQGGAIGKIYSALSSGGGGALNTGALNEALGGFLSSYDPMAGLTGVASPQMLYAPADAAIGSLYPGLQEGVQKAVDVANNVADGGYAAPGSGFNISSAGAGLAGGLLGNFLGTELTGDPKSGSALGGQLGTLAAVAFGAGPLSMLGLAAFPVMTLMDSIFGSEDSALSDYRAAQNAANTEAKKAASGTSKYGYASGTEGLPEGGERWIALNNDYGQGVYDESGRMRIEPYFAGSQADQPTSRYGNIGLEKTAAGPAPEGPPKYVSWYLFDTPQSGLGAATTFAPYSEMWGPYSDGRSGSTQMYTNTGTTTYDDWAAARANGSTSSAAFTQSDADTVSTLLGMAQAAQDDQAQSINQRNRGILGAGGTQQGVQANGLAGVLSGGMNNSQPGQPETVSQILETLTPAQRMLLGLA